NQVVENQAQVWASVLERVEHQLAERDAEREKRFQGLLTAFTEAHERQSKLLQPAARELSEYRADLGQLVGGLTDLMRDRGELLAMQKQLSENLRLLRETRQIDQALNGLTGAIHLLTARSDHRAA